MKINEKDVKKLMESLAITREEAIDILAYDNDEVDNEEAKAIEEKVKDTAPAKKPKGSPLDKVKNARAKKKVDEIKDQLVSKVNAMLDLAGATNPQQMTSSKVTFMIGKEYFSISVTKHKTKPDGYAEED